MNFVKSGHLSKQDSPGQTLGCPDKIKCTVVYMEKQFYFNILNTCQVKAVVHTLLTEVLKWLLSANTDESVEKYTKMANVTLEWPSPDVRL